jgi:hypothetical protein
LSTRIRLFSPRGFSIEEKKFSLAGEENELAISGGGAKGGWSVFIRSVSNEMLSLTERVWIKMFPKSSACLANSSVLSSAAAILYST